MGGSGESRYATVWGEARADALEFIAALEEFERSSAPFFRAGEDVFVARAPGRLDVMGGIADYSGSLVLELPIAEATFVAAQRDRERALRIVSARSAGAWSEATVHLNELVRDGEPVDYATARAYFARSPEDHWAAYVAGVPLALMRERGAAIDHGARLFIWSRVPEGKGVSSSAALEVAAMMAFAAAFDLDLDALELALLCQLVENVIVGAPCGAMDQVTVACGEAWKLLALLCQPAKIEGALPIPEELGFWGIDSGERHSVGGSDYTSVRVGTFMGYRIIAELAGLRVERTERPGLVQIEDKRWGGYLVNLTPSEFEQRFAKHLPERIAGAEFLDRYVGTTDPVTRIEPEREYAVRAPTAHAVYEHFRVRAFAELLGGARSERKIKLLGELMYQSHASYGACGLGSTGTDLLVELVREAGPVAGLYGAKITGGGSGGTVAVLGRREAERAIQAIAERFAARTGHAPQVFAGSSPGAAAFGLLRLKKSPG